MSTSKSYVSFLLGLLLVGVKASSIDSSAYSSSNHESVQQLQEELMHEQKVPEPDPVKKRPLKTLGLFDDRYGNNTITVCNLEDETKRDVLPHLNLKELKRKKHRVMHDVEIAQRKLIEGGLETALGELDTTNLLKLMNAENARAQNPERAKMGYRKIWTLEELDRKYPTPEGNRRLGLASNDQVKIVPKVERWKKTSHLVDIGKPGARPELLPDYVLNYKQMPVQVDIIIKSSIGCHYLLRVDVQCQLRHLKYTIWEHEAYYRYNYSNLSIADQARGYDIKKQILLCNGRQLQKLDNEHSLEFLGIKNFSIIRVLEKLEIGRCYQA